MSRKERSLLGVAKEQEAKSLEQEQEYARYLAEEPFREAAETQHIQAVIDILGRAYFLKNYSLKPEIVGAAGLTDVYGEFTTPVFAIEYANLKFNPREHGVHEIKYPGEWQYEGRGPFRSRSFRRNFSRDERKIIDKYAPNVFEPSFEAVALCSGCQTWGVLGKFEDRYRALYIDQPRVSTYDDIAHNIDLFNSGTSGLALDCGTLPVFGLDPSKVSAAIGCDNLREAIQEENNCRVASDEEKGQVNYESVVFKSLRNLRGDKG